MHRRDSDAHEALARLEEWAARAKELPERASSPGDALSALATEGEELAQRLRAILEACPDEALVRDALAAYDDGPALRATLEVGSWRILRSNRRLAEAVGRAPAALVGRDFRELVAPDDRAVAGAILDALGRGQAPRRAEIRLAGPGGEPLRVSLSGSVDGAGEPPRLRLRLDDVGYDRLLEAELRQSQRQATVGRLARGVAHDLNNLITVIRATVALASDAARDAAGSDLEDIDRAAARAAELTQQLLVFSRPRPGAPRSVDLDESLERTARLLRRALGEDVTLAVERDAPLPPVWADAAQLEQLVTQLVLSAPAAVGRGDLVTLCASNLDLDEAAARELGLTPGPYVRVEVAQTLGRSSIEGPVAAPPGADDAPWVPTEPATDPGALASCESIARQAGGALRVHRGAGDSVRFEVYLRPASPVAAAEHAPSPPKVAGHGERILLVDDDGLLRGVVRRILENAGYAVSEAGDARTAMASAQVAAPYDLLITDVVMPDLGGPKLAQELTARGLAQRVLYVTGHAGELVARHGIDEAQLDLLAKPFVPARLLARVRQLLDQQAKS